MTKRSLTLIFLLLVFAFGFYKSQYSKPSTQVSTIGSNMATAVLGAQTKVTDCVIRGALPDASCTPGAIISTATKDQICKSGYTKTVRNVPTALKNEVFHEYGIVTHSPGEYEIDHLVSLELGGSNDISNLWPEAADPTPGFHEKDGVENTLHSQVCSGTMTLVQAQEVIAKDWSSVYKTSN